MSQLETAQQAFFKLSIKTWSGDTHTIIQSTLHAEHYEPSPQIALNRTFNDITFNS